MCTGFHSENPKSCCYQGRQSILACSSEVGQWFPVKKLTSTSLRGWGWCSSARAASGCGGSRSEAAPGEKARAARGGQPAACCFLCLDPMAQGAPAGWPSTEVGTFMWRLFLPEDNALGQETCPGARHLSPGPRRQGRAEGPASTAGPGGICLCGLRQGEPLPACML